MLINDKTIIFGKRRPCIFSCFQSFMNTKLFSSHSTLILYLFKTREIHCSKICHAFLLQDQFSISNSYQACTLCLNAIIYFYCSNSFQDTHMRRKKVFSRITIFKPVIETMDSLIPVKGCTSSLLSNPNHP